MADLNLRLEVYDPKARRLVVDAQSLAESRCHAVVQPLHLLYVLVDGDPVVQRVLARLDVDPVDVLVEAEAAIRSLRSDPTAEPPAMSGPMLELLGRAEGEAARDRAGVSPAQLLLAVAQEARGDVQVVLRHCGLSAPVVRAALASLPPEPTAESHAGPGNLERHGDDPAAWMDPSRPPHDPPLPAELWQFGDDWTAMAMQGRFDPTIGRDGVLRRMLQILVRRRHHNPCIAGDPGVGKRAIVKALAQRMATGDVPPMLHGKRMLALDTAVFAAAPKPRGQLEERVRTLLGAVRAAAGGVIVYVPDMAPLFTRSNASMVALFSAALARQELQLIATTTPEVLRRVNEEFPGLSEQLADFVVEAPTHDDAVAILRGIAPRFEQAHGLRISDAALLAAARLGRRYVPSVQLPKVAVDLIDEAAARVRVELHTVPAALDALERRLQVLRAERRSLEDEREPRARQQSQHLAEQVEALEQRVATERAALKAVADGQRHDQVDAEDVAEVVALWTGIPISKMMEEEASKLLRMEAHLEQHVIGQQQALAAVARAVRRGRVGLRDPQRPIGSFLFLGPSGVGKTELAKALATFLFDDPHALTRLDMSEFMEKHMVARLLGSPPGYVDSDAGGYLTEAVRQRPYSVLLFDEIEKAHPDVFNVLLQVLDDGRLTDSRGRLATFNDTVVIMTSNLGSESILQLGADREQMQAAVDSALKAAFRPEFLNRIDDVVVFNALSAEDLRGIVDIQLRHLGGLLQGRDISLTVTEGARDRLAALGYEPAFGARPLKRAILRHLQDPLADAVLKGEVHAGQTIAVDHDGERFTVRPASNTMA